MPNHEIPYRKAIRLPDDAYRNPESRFHIVLRAMAETAPFRREVGEHVWATVMSERNRGSAVLEAACLLPDHLHMIVGPGDRDIVAWLNAFKSFTTSVAKRVGGPRRLWQPSFFDRRIRDEQELEDTLAYVRANPVAAGLVAAETDWPWLWWNEPR